MLPGDLTNDGTKGQFELLMECIQDTVFRRSQFQNTGEHSRETLHGTKIFPVCGNHDRMAFSMQASEEKGQNHYARFQEWLFGNVIFISGHTHLSMNHPEGCVEWDEKHGNLYINDGSVRPTDLLPGEPMQPKEWKEGTWLDITVCDRKVEIITRSVKDGRRHARGYYHIYPYADSQPKQP